MLNFVGHIVQKRSDHYGDHVRMPPKAPRAATTAGADVAARAVVAPRASPQGSSKRALEDADAIIAKRNRITRTAMNDTTAAMYRSRLAALQRSGDFGSVGEALRTVTPMVWAQSLASGTNSGASKALAASSVHAYVDTAMASYKALVETEDSEIEKRAMLARYELWTAAHTMTGLKRASAAPRDQTNTSDDPTDDPTRTRPTSTQLLADLARFRTKLGVGSAHYAYTAYQATGPPRRNADFDNLRVAFTAPKDEQNTLVVTPTTATLHLFGHKTAKAIGAVVIKLSGEQAKLVIESVRTAPRDYYLVKPDGTAVKELTPFIQGTQKSETKLYGCNVFRRNYADKLLTKEMDELLSEYNRIGKRLRELVLPVVEPASMAMGNSAGVICTEYRKADRSWSEETRASLHALFQRKP